MKKFIVILLLTSSVFTACKKYEDDNGIHLKTAKSRVCRDWKLGAYYVNGQDLTATYNTTVPNMVFTVKKDGSFIQMASYLGFSYTRSGTWKFLNSKEEIGIYETSPNTGSSQFKITKLSVTEFWFINIDGTKEEYHLIPK